MRAFARRNRFTQILVLMIIATLGGTSVATEISKKELEKMSKGQYEESHGHFQLQGDIVPIAEDGIHDPTDEDIEKLQPPAEAMLHFPRDARGVVNWVKTLDQGLINPRTGVTGKEKMHAVDFDVIFENTASMPYVRFPHRPHTMWLTCKNCHPGIFIPQRGANPITMAKIISGQYCGVCHGKVAFPPYECNRCHRVPRQSVGLRYK